MKKLKNFNIKYRNHYNQLNKNQRNVISDLDCIDSLIPNYEVWKRVSLRGDNINLEKTFLLSKKLDRLNRNLYENFNNSKNNPTLNIRNKKDKEKEEFKLLFMKNLKDVSSKQHPSLMSLQKIK